MSILETSQYISKDVAIEIIEQGIPDEIFININQLPKKPILID